MNKLVTVLTMSLSVYLLFLVFVIIAVDSRPEDGVLQPIYTDIPARDLYVELPDVDYVHPIMSGLQEAQKAYRVVEVTYTEMELTYLGTYFITAYCPAECGGSWSTASGATCHRADYEDRIIDPTTCAIDRRYHSFGDTFYIAEFDRTFVAEDTGPGVQGHWIDLFYEDYDDVLSFPTGYYTVYSVEWVEITYMTGEYTWDN